jgi:hypothetical protein
VKPYEQELPSNYFIPLMVETKFHTHTEQQLLICHKEYHITEINVGDIAKEIKESHTTKRPFNYDEFC